MVADRWMSELQNSIGNDEARLCVSRDRDWISTNASSIEPHLTTTSVACSGLTILLFLAVK